MSTSGRPKGDLRGTQRAASAKGSPLKPMADWWRTRAERERQGLTLAALAVSVLLLWWVLLGPALRTARTASADRQALQMQLLQMQKLATESKELRALPPIAAAQAAQALNASSLRLGDRAKLAQQGDRWTLNFSKLQPDELRAWLAEARSAARARPVDAQVLRGPDGLSGSIAVMTGANP